MHNPKRSAFTLIEVLVVVSLIAIIIAMLMPALGKFRDSANDLVCQKNMANLMQGQVAYVNDNDQYFTPADRWVWSEGRLPLPGQQNAYANPTGANNVNSGDPTSLAGVMNGLLIEYYNVQESYVCPVADKMLPKRGWWAGESMVRSYVQTWNVGPYGFDRQSISDEETYDSVEFPADLAVFAEENTFAIDGGWQLFQNTGMNDGYFIAQNYDYLGSFHGTGPGLDQASTSGGIEIYDNNSELASGFSYAAMVDGHVEQVTYRGRTSANITYSRMYCDEDYANER